MTCRVVVLLTGRGSNFRAIAEAGLPIEIAAVISNRPQAAGLTWAREHGLNAIALDHTEYADREAFDARLASEIESPWGIHALRPLRSAKFLVGAADMR